MSDIQRRKAQHIELAMDEGSQNGADLWSKYLLPYMALPEVDLDKVDTGAELLGKRLKQPLIIASMTGGSQHAGTINTNLAMAAAKMRVAMGVGSQRVALEKEEARKTFQAVRKYNPRGVVFANMGAVQLNYGRSIEDYRRVVEMVAADALYLHINPLQEAIQPEGDTNWTGLLAKIEKLVKKVGVPVWAKEVGNGLDPVTAKRLVDIGVTGIDAAGVGGTSWTWIEGRRAGSKNLTKWFSGFGWPTDVLVPELVKIRKGKREVRIVASGGVRSPVQALKSRLLGADFYSAARPFLAAALQSAEVVERELADWERGLKIAMFGIGAKDWKEAQKKSLVAQTPLKVSYV